MQQALRGPIAIPSEAVEARAEAAFKPVVAWAWLGGAILVFQLYVWAKWISGPYFAEVPPGPSAPPLWMRSVLSILFEFSPDARVEYIHPGDAGTAFARAVTCEAAIGRILNVGGGEKCRLTHREFCNELMDAIGIGPLPVEAFVRSEVPRFFGDWVDTEESQRLLHYQERGLGELKADMRRDLRAVAPLIRLLRPLATWFVLRASPYLEKNKEHAA